jgi:hypothetical protein
MALKPSSVDSRVGLGVGVGLSVGVGVGVEVGAGAVEAGGDFGNMAGHMPEVPQAATVPTRTATAVPSARRRKNEYAGISRLLAGTESAVSMTGQAESTSKPA